MASFVSPRISQRWPARAIPCVVLGAFMLALSPLCAQPLPPPDGNGPPALTHVDSADGKHCDRIASEETGRPVTMESDEGNTAVLLVKSTGSSSPSLTVENATSLFAGATTLGWLTLASDYSCEQPERLRAAAFEAADSLLDWPAYSRVFVVFAPPASGCGFAARGGLSAFERVSPLHGRYTVKTYLVREDLLSQAGTALLQHLASDGAVPMASASKGRAVTFQPAVNAPPTTVSATPSVGSGSSQSFRFRYADPDGFSDLVWTRVNINATSSSAGACLLEYNQPNDTLRISTDDGSGFSAAVPIAQANTLQNSQCRVFFASAFGLSSTDFALNAILVFKAGFAGPKTIFLSAQDTAAQDTGWQARASFTAVANQPPSAVSIAPASGSGASQTFSLVATDPNGFADIYSIDLLINANLTSSGACYLYFYPNSNLLYLQSDTSGFLGPISLGQAGSLQNSRCTVDGPTSSFTQSGSNVQVNLAISFNPAFAGAKDLSSRVDDYGGASPGRKVLGSWRVSFGPDQPPVPVSVNPGTGSGASQTFTFVFDDPDGFADISTAYALFNAYLDAHNSCYIAFDRLANAVYLLDDAAINSSRLDLAGAGTVQNSQCSVDASGSSSFGINNDLTLRLVMTFKPAFAGPKTVWLAAADMSGSGSGLQSRGAWTVTNPGNQPPAVSSASPPSGGGSSQTFALVYTEPNGFSDLAFTTFLINGGLDGRNACYIVYDRASNGLYLVNNAGTGSTRVSIGSTATAQNTQCILNGAGSEVACSGTGLTLNIALTFKPAFAGSKTLYMSAQDLTGLNTGLQPRGSYSVSFGAAQPPSPVSVSPNGSSGASQTFSVLFADPNGFADISWTTVLLNSRLDGANACFIFYDRATNALYLINDAGTGSSRVDFGSVDSIQNSQCALNGSGSSVSGSNNNLMLNLAVSFKTSFGGNKTIYANAADSASLTSGLQQMGSYTVTTGSETPPSAISVNPASGSGASQTFSFLFSHPNGFTALTTTSMLINSVVDGANACFVVYDRATAAVYLINDTGTGSTRVDLGSAATAQNSQCSLSGAGSSVSGSGNDLTVNLSLAFKNAFSGTKTVYMNAQDGSGQSTGLQPRGTWVAP